MEGGREEGREEGGRDGGREGGRKEGREQGKEGGRKRGREDKRMEEKEWKDGKEGKTRGLEKRVNQKKDKRERLVEVGEGEDWEMWGKGGWMRGGERIKGKENEIQ